MNLAKNILSEMDAFYTKFGVIPNTIIADKKILINELEKYIEFKPTLSDVNKFADMDIVDIPSIKKHIICLRLDTTNHQIV